MINIYLCCSYCDLYTTYKKTLTFDSYLAWKKIVLPKLFYLIDYFI